MKSIKIGIAGMGVVGSGVAAVLKRNSDEIARRAGRGIELAVVATRTRSKAEPLAADARKGQDGKAGHEVINLGGGKTPISLLDFIRKIEDRLGKKAEIVWQPMSASEMQDTARQADATGRRDVAEGYYLQLTRLKPQDANPWFQLGNLYAEQGRLDSAERAYREALRRRDDAKTLHNLGLVQVKLGIGALREAQHRLPPADAARQETRELLRTLLETALP